MEVLIREVSLYYIMYPLPQVKDKEDGKSVKLHAFCSNPDRPVCLIRGLCSELDVDISLFSSESLTKTSPDHEVEIRDQVRGKGEGCGQRRKGEGKYDQVGVGGREGGNLEGCGQVGGGWGCNEIG